MPAKLRCVEGSLEGKRVVLEVGKVRKIRIGTADDAPLLTFSFEGECWQVASDRDIELNGKVSNCSILHSGDRLHAGGSYFEFESDEIVSVDFMAETRDESDDVDEHSTDSGQRARRKISASHKAVLQEPDGQKQGLLGRVGKAFRRRDERIERLEDLEAQRNRVLNDAGRFCFQKQGGLGLPQESLVRLFRGESIELSYESLTRNHIDHFRSLRDRLLFLDAEINACRMEMGLEAENHNTLEKLHLRADKEAEEENAYLAMDAVATVENEFDLHSGSEDAFLDIGERETEAMPKTESPMEELLVETEELEPNQEHTDVIQRDPAERMASAADVAEPTAEQQAQQEEQRQRSSRRRSVGGSSSARRRRRTR